MPIPTFKRFDSCFEVARLRTHQPPRREGHHNQDLLVIAELKRIC